jgi:nucleotide-binding universal stress UspA family protein
MTERVRLRSGPVVVAVDGSDDGKRALMYGASEAARRDAGLRLVHAVPQGVPIMAAMLPSMPGDPLADIGGDLLRDAERDAREAAPDVEVESVLTAGPRVRAILGHCRDASVIVVGPRSSATRRLLTGSTSTGLAAHAACPVVAVPASWDDAREDGVVVAGVDGSPDSGDLIEAAFQTAQEREARLVLLHAWRPISVYDSAIVGRTGLDEWRAATRHLLDGFAAGPARGHPDVQMETVVDYDAPAHALIEASRRADLLIVGRTGAGAPFGLTLGSVARAAIHHAECPVEVLPHFRH